MSIGDVLTLLRGEFADITISKIRFLESQGLVNPERSPSGYRKFYEHDVERLRWVLRQQRENFLPLKVIRDRLAKDGDVCTDPRSLETATSREVDGLRGAARRATNTGSLRTPAQRGPAQGGPVQRDKVSLSSVASVAAAGIGDPGHTVRLSSIPEGPPVLSDHLQGEPSVGIRLERESKPGLGSSAEQDQPIPGAAKFASFGVAPETATVAELRDRDGSFAKDMAADGEAAAKGARVPEPPSIDTQGTDLQGAEFVRSPGHTGASLNAEELSASSQLSQTEIATLEGYGLLSPTLIGGAPYYDEESLTIARLVKDFGRYGIEPRHLRLYCNFVARETSLVEQVITPLLRQRNPEARHRAGEAAVEIARLGQALRGSLMRREIRRELGG